MKKRFYILLLISFLLSLADVQAQQKATPKAGEGISTFLLRHNRAPKKYYDDFVELNKAKLGKGNVLKLGVTYTIPPVKRSTAADKETPARKQSSKASKIGYQRTNGTPFRFGRQWLFLYPPAKPDQ